jgi:sarcosine oxidase, subunit gamma
LRLRSRSIRKESGFMREMHEIREMTWPPARRAEGTLLERPRLRAQALSGRGSTLISGDLGAAIQALAPGAAILGLYELAPESAHALRIARDRALLATPSLLGATDGWRDGWCATSVDDGWAAVDIAGPDAAFALAQGTSADLAGGSPSAAVLIAGLRCLLVRTEAGFRLHVEAPWLETLLTWLDGA